MKAQYITAAEIAQALGVSISSAYNIIKSLNKELSEMGYIIIAGKCPIAYFKKKYYGFDEST